MKRVCFTGIAPLLLLTGVAQASDGLVSAPSVHSATLGTYQLLETDQWQDVPRATITVSGRHFSIDFNSVADNGRNMAARLLVDGAAWGGDNGHAVIQRDGMLSFAHHMELPADGPHTFAIQTRGDAQATLSNQFFDVLAHDRVSGQAAVSVHSAVPEAFEVQGTGAWQDVPGASITASGKAFSIDFNSIGSDASRIAVRLRVDDAVWGGANGYAITQGDGMVSFAHNIEFETDGPHVFAVQMNGDAGATLTNQFFDVVAHAQVSGQSPVSVHSAVPERYELHGTSGWRSVPGATITASGNVFSIDFNSIGDNACWLGARLLVDGAVWGGTNGYARIKGDGMLNFARNIELPTDGPHTFAVQTCGNPCAVLTNQFFDVVSYPQVSEQSAVRDHSVTPGTHELLGAGGWPKVPGAHTTSSGNFFSTNLNPTGRNGFGTAVPSLGGGVGGGVGGGGGGFSGYPFPTGDAVPSPARDPHTDPIFDAATSDVSPVPEPTTLVVWSILGGLALIAARRRWKAP